MSYFSGLRRHLLLRYTNNRGGTVLRSALILGLSMILGACDSAAQRRPNPDARDNGKSVTISGRVGGKTLNASGVGRCKHAPEASIYDVPAALWMVEYSTPDNGQLKQLNLTLWRPKNGGPDQISLAAETGSGSHRVNIGGRQKQEGSGTVKLSPSGAGGRFEFKGKDAAGTSLEVEISCPEFAGVEAEGG
jgi:hypothetical protein